MIQEKHLRWYFFFQKSLLIEKQVSCLHVQLSGSTCWVSARFQHTCSPYSRAVLLLMFSQVFKIAFILWFIHFETICSWSLAASPLESCAILKTAWGVVVCKQWKTTRHNNCMHRCIIDHYYLGGGTTTI